jgi:hypothetical protein
MPVYKPTLQTVTLGIAGALGGGLLAVAVGRHWPKWSLVGTVTLPTLEVLGKMIKGVISSRRATEERTELEMSIIEKGLGALIGQIPTINADVRRKAQSHVAMLKERNFPEEATELFRQTLETQVKAWALPEGASFWCCIHVRGGEQGPLNNFFLSTEASVKEGKARIGQALGYDDVQSSRFVFKCAGNTVEDDQLFFGERGLFQIVIPDDALPYARSRALLGN